MFKAIGIVVVIGVIALGVAHFTGHLNLSGDVNVTKKGHTLMDEGLDGAQNLTNKGFNALRSEKAEVKGKK